MPELADGGVYQTLAFKGVRVRIPLRIRISAKWLEFYIRYRVPTYMDFRRCLKLGQIDLSIRHTEFHFFLATKDCVNVNSCFEKGVYKMANEEVQRNDSDTKAKKANTTKGRKSKINASNAKTTSPWKFPKNTLEDALKIAKALEEKYAGNPTRAEDLVKAVGFNKSNDWRFQDLLKSGSLYGITSGSGATALVKLEKLGEDIVSPSSPDQRQKALLGAFRNVEDFKEVENFYKGKKIPEDEFFENTLIRSFNISR